MTDAGKQDYEVDCKKVVCGNSMKVTVKHPKQQYSYEACIHMSELAVFAVRCSQGTVLGSTGCFLPGKFAHFLFKLPNHSYHFNHKMGKFCDCMKYHFVIFVLEHLNCLQ